MTFCYAALIKIYWIKPKLINKKSQEIKNFALNRKIVYKEKKLEDSKNTILIVDDESSILLSLKYLLKEYQVVTCDSSLEAKSLLEDKQFDIVISDQKMPQLEGLQLLKFVKEKYPETIRILMTGYAEMDVAVGAINEGEIFHYIKKPWEPEEFKTIIYNACLQYNEDKKQSENKFRYQNQELLFHKLGPSKSMQQVADEAVKVYNTNFTVLITGESGTGKEVLCKAIHQHSKRSDAPLISVNCGAIPENLIESELFGYEKGAFTGANTRKIGLIESAQNGTFFLDEISELPLLMQSRLLRVLQEKVVRRVGGNQDIPLNVRFIAASNKNLKEMVENNQFREDLYYRIAEYNIQLSPLRERKADILYLAEVFIDATNQELEKNVTLSDQASQILLRHSWPGNIRELRNAVRKAVLLSDDEILPECLNFIPQTEKKLHESASNCEEEIELEVKTILEENRSFKDILNYQVERIEKKLITGVLKALKGNKTQASRVMQIDYKTLYNKIKKYHITKNDYTEKKQN